MEQKEDFRHIVRVSNTDLDGNRKILDGIRKIKGVGFAFANAVCTVANIDKSKRTGVLTDDEVKRLDEAISKASERLPLWLLNRRKSFENASPAHLVTNDLIFANETDIRQMMRIKSYRGIRHSQGAPVRGQRTRSNFRRNKGKVMGVIKSKAKAGKKQ